MNKYWQHRCCDCDGVRIVKAFNQERVFRVLANECVCVGDLPWFIHEVVIPEGAVIIFNESPEQ